MDESTARRSRSLALLAERSIPHNPHLPRIETEAECELKTLPEILRRAVATFCAIQVACDIRDGNDVDYARSFFEELLRNYGLSQADLTSKERTLWDGERDERLINQIGWRYEAINFLLWSVGLMDELPFPDEILNIPPMYAVFKTHKTMDALLSHAKLRPKAELLDLSDYIYCLRWASVDAIVKSQPQPAGIDYSVLMERHRAINWLTCAHEADFDAVSLDT